MLSLSLRNINKIYEGGIQAVNNFNLDIKYNEFIIIVGPSGCGKSTALRMIAGLEEITSGELYIDGVLMNNVEPKDRNIAMVFQNYALYPHMTVKQNMSYALRINKTPAFEIEEKVQNAAQILGLEEVLERKPKALSGGQRQRVALGRAIVRNPRVFLMDEPLSNLDAKLRVQTRAEIIRLHERLNTTFVYVTHDQTEAMTMGDRIVIMNGGVIQQVDTPHNVYFYPENLFVAGFIGSPQMNFVYATVKKTNNGYSLVFLENELPLENSLGLLVEEKGYLNQSLILGIRPEHIYLEPKNNDLKVKATIDLVELLGSEKHLHVLVGSSRLLAKISSDYPVKSRQEITLFFDQEKLHFFDPGTEKNITLAKNKK